MSAQNIVTTLNERILTIRFNRPEKKNAITSAMYAQMADALLEAEASPEVRVVLFAGTADTFCSGNDMQDFLAASGSIHDAPVARFMRTLAVFTKPVVAAVNGPAVGIGTTLLLHCDLVYAGEGARLQLPFVSLGVCPEFCSSYLLPRIMGHVKAAELILLGEAIGAQKACELGLVNAVVPAAEVEALALQKAQRLAQQAPASLRVSKMLMKRFNDTALNASLTVELDYFGEMLRGPEIQEAVAAFMQKRKPDFSGFN
ncbi:MAG: enoyl-CoA hydratase [bacterium]|nr:enoyl-CoA hydratase [bacterium]